MSNTVARGFHHAGIRVFDYEKTLKFYKEVLGLKEVLSWGEGDKRIAILEFADGSCIEVFAGGTDEHKPKGAWLHIAIATDNCDEAIAAVRAAGMEIIKEPSDSTIKTRVARHAFCKGPDGELIEFFEQK
ncbi:MAG: Lactoylglutathione lyase [Firmicutes bacterium ADurb.Bin193]|nr:MAG: Lactoylglutathione lyase [Firmicutes bacterium ADurb.Bin193]